jgi:hypothetical protein
VLDQLRRYGQIHGADLSTSVWYHLVAPPLQAATELSDKSIGDTAACIQALVNDEVTKRRFRNEQKNHSGH